MATLQRQAARTSVALAGRKRRHPVRNLLLFLVLVVVVVVVLVAALAGGGSAKYGIQVTSVVHYSDRTVGVAFQVKNTGTGSGAPSCTVTAASSSTNGNVKGVVLASIKPGQYDYEAAADDRITLPGPGASVITASNGDVAVKC